MFRNFNEYQIPAEKEYMKLQQILSCQEKKNFHVFLNENTDVIVHSSVEIDLEEKNLSKNKKELRSPSLLVILSTKVFSKISEKKTLFACTKPLNQSIYLGKSNPAILFR